MTKKLEDWYLDWKGWNRESFGKPSKDESAYCDAELGPYIASNGVRVLELGFGNGGLLGWCRDRGHDCVGIESSPLLMARASKAGFETVTSLAEARRQYGDHSFDLVVALDVLEHIPGLELPSVLDDFHALMKTEAVLVARFPNGDSPFGRASQHGDITHVTVLGSGTFNSLAVAANFNIERFKEPAIPLRGVGVGRLCKRLSSKAWRLVIGALISHAYFTGGYRVLSANMVAILRPRPPVLPNVDRTVADVPSASRAAPGIVDG